MVTFTESIPKTVDTRGCRDIVGNGRITGGPRIGGHQAGIGNGGTVESDSRRPLIGKSGYGRLPAEPGPAAHRCIRPGFATGEGVTVMLVMTVSGKHTAAVCHNQPNGEGTGIIIYHRRAADPVAMAGVPLVNCHCSRRARRIAGIGRSGQVDRAATHTLFTGLIAATADP